MNVNTTFFWKLHKSSSTFVEKEVLMKYKFSRVSKPKFSQSYLFHYIKLNDDLLRHS